MAHMLRTIRLTVDEHSFIEGACKALDCTRSQLFHEALLETIHQLGVYVGAKVPPAPTEPWPFVPRRGEESTSYRITISLSPTLNELLATAASLVNVGETMFLVGSALRYVGRLQKVNKDNEALQAMRLPAHYR